MPLTLSHTPGEWDGTFALALRLMATDLLDDGPVEITVDGAQRLLTGYAAGALAYSDGTYQMLDDITGVEVP